MSREEKIFNFDSRIPVTWLMGCVFGLISAFLWAGWQARDLYEQIGRAIKVGQDVLQEQASINNKIVDLGISSKIHSSEIEQLKINIARIESKK